MQMYQPLAKTFFYSAKPMCLAAFV